MPGLDPRSPDLRTSYSHNLLGFHYLSEEDLMHRHPSPSHSLHPWVQRGRLRLGEEAAHASKELTWSDGEKKESWELQDLLKTLTQGAYEMVNKRKKSQDIEKPSVGSCLPTEIWGRILEGRLEGRWGEIIIVGAVATCLQ